MSVQTASPTNAFPAIARKQGDRSFNLSFADRRALLVLVDAMLVLLSVWAATLLWQQTAGRPLTDADIEGRWYWYPIMLCGWWALAWLSDLYDVASSDDRISSVVRVVITGALILVIYVFAFFLAPRILPRLFFGYFLLVVLPLIIVWRWACATLFSAPAFRRRMLVVGGEGPGQFIASALKRHTSHYQVLGYADLSDLLRQRRIDEIVVASAHELEDGLVQLLIDCQAQGFRVSRMPDLYEKLYRRMPIQYIDNSWALDAIIDRSSTRLYLIIKRAMDIVIAGIGLMFLAPFFPILALAIKLDSPGPVFYRPERLGQGGKPFRLWKFRTMVPDADRIGDPTFTTRNDQRVTRVGRILRATHVDELPQLINVVAGDMSLVGPRPERHVPELEENIPYYRARYAVKPGATGWALVKQGYAEGLEDTLIKLQYDLYYIKNRSLFFDIFILYKSAVHMLTMRGR